MAAENIIVVVYGENKTPYYIVTKKNMTVSEQCSSVHMLEDLFAICNDPILNNGGDGGIVERIYG